MFLTLHHCSPMATVRKGRGAVGNPAGRYETYLRERDLAEEASAGLDGSDEAIGPSAVGAPVLPPTVVSEEACRTIISRNASPDVPFDRSINPYRGCEHGCVYCFARPSHAYLGLSPGLDFETRLFAKVNAAEVLARELAKPGYRPRTIMIGANTDAYQPIERTHRITRRILEVLAAHQHPVAIATKSALILRDLDLLADMAKRRLVSVGISVTTLDAGLARIMEPRASSPKRRLQTIAALARGEVPVSVLAAPIIPVLNDHELERILTAATAAGATTATYVLLRLPLELKDGFSAWLKAHVPGKAKHVLSRLRACRDGNLYVADFGTRMRGTGEYAALLSRRFSLACRRLGLAEAGPAARHLDVTGFRVPSAPERQLRLL
jgi:DNA repair photolyase